MLSESDNKDLKTSKHYESWQSLCKDRNKEAFAVISNTNTEELKVIMSRKALDILYDRSSKYQNSKNPKMDIENELLKNIEPLLFRLFSDGPTKISSKEKRFGRQGSLVVSISGKDAGKFYDFSEQKGGNLISLIQKTQTLDYVEAKNWANKFLGESSNYEISHNSLKKPEYKKDLKWESLKPREEIESLELGKISKALEKSYNLVAHHKYTNSDGSLLFYNLRLQDKFDPSNKIVLPYSYGYYLERPSKKTWALKRFTQETGTPLYNLHLLEKYPHKPVLLVEGEKAADTGNRLLEDKLICLSWMGGAGGVNKADWKLLANRDVTIWPDNDEAGYQAANNIEVQLKKIGPKSLQIVDCNYLKKELPHKWDIADPIPYEKSKKFILDTILRAEKIDLCNKIVNETNERSIDKSYHIEI